MLHMYMAFKGEVQVDEVSFWDTHAGEMIAHAWQILHLPQECMAFKRSIKPTEKEENGCVYSALFTLLDV